MKKPLLALTLLTACGTSQELAMPSRIASAPNNQTMPQLLKPERLKAYKDALPKILAPAIRAIIEDNDTLWYDHEVMIPTYQDTVGDGSYTPTGIRKNSDGARLIVPQGRPLFSDDGETWSFPFAGTAGTDHSEGLHIVDFMHLPKVDGHLLPVVYWITRDPGGLGGLGLHRWSWMFPKGTVFGEVIFLKGQDGKFFPLEVRTRERFLEGWAVNSFRPFPTANSLKVAVQKMRPDWQKTNSLRDVVAHLENPHTLTPKSLDSNHFKGVFAQSGAIDELPDFGDDSLVRDLLTQTEFSSAYGSVWKADEKLVTYGASTKAKFSVVPNNNDIGLIEVNEASCSRCHQDAQRPIEDFAPEAVLYGDVWGSDQIFSFHIFDETRFNGAGDENRSVRPVFKNSNVVVKYEPSIHGAAYYKKLSQ